MKLDKILIAIGVFSLIVFFIVTNYRASWNTEYFKWTYLISLIVLFLLFLFRKNRVIIYVQIVLLLIFGSGLLSYLRIPGGSAIAGIAHIAFLITFIATLNYDSFKLGIPEKIFAVVLSLVLLVKPILLFADTIPRGDIDKFAFILLLLLIWPFYRNFKYGKDLYRIFILLGLLHFGAFIL